MGFAIASQRSVTLVVQLETKNGLKYKTQIQVGEGSELKEFALPFANFTAADDSADVNAPLDLKQIGKILFLDVTGFSLGDNHFSFRCAPFND